MATFAPSAARRFAIAAPMPREPPVMSATFPSRFLAIVFLLLLINLALSVPPHAQPETTAGTISSESDRWGRDRFLSMHHQSRVPSHCRLATAPIMDRKHFANNPR